MQVFQEINLFSSALDGNIKQLEDSLKNGYDINICTENGFNLLMINIALGTNNSEYVKYLIEKGLDINHQNERGQTALHFASCKASIDVVKILLDNGINVNLVDDEKCNALHYACESVPLFSYTKLNELDVSAILKRGVESLYIETPLTFSEKQEIRQNQLKIVEMLLETDINLNQTNKKGQTAVDLAVLNDYYNSLDMVKLLSEKGVKLNVGLMPFDIYDELICGGPIAFICDIQKRQKMNKKIKAYKEKLK